MKKIYKTEFHIHTRCSKDSMLAFSILLLMAKIKKVNTLVITDHNEISGALKCKEKFKKHGINVVVGEEIFTKDGEIIGLNLKNKIEKNLSVEKTIKEIKKQNGLIYIPHPYDEKRYKTVLKEKYIEKYKDDIDFIEIHNGRNISKKFSEKQEDIATKHNLRKIIGSDAHTFFEIGRNVVLTEKEITEDNLSEIKIKKVIKKDCIKFSHICTKYVRLLKMILGGNYNEIFRVINRKIKKGK